ncbi:MAG: 16S rRNA (cytidine(1402)-2'-O)-methyltransferase [Armatimonadetes bacterium]|nr:16S rRNA (cytidine(1402)-2'-O)-methyltransferase [Armatimonadota bacterium]
MPHGTLFICGTPIGNLEDVTFRVLRTLREVGLVAAEDTRITRRLLTRYQIETPLVSYHEYSSPRKTENLVKELVSGKSIALVCNAGTPGLSDPGLPLVSAAISNGITVSPIPGPSAAVAALSASGFPAQQLLFLGFLPKKSQERRKKLAKYAEVCMTAVIYESPDRIVKSLHDLLETWGDRRMAAFREMTKIHEEVLRGTVSEVLCLLSEKGPRGEFTLVVEGSVPPEAAVTSDVDFDVGLWLTRTVEPATPTKELTALLVGETGWSRNRAYQAVVEWKRGAGDVSE